MQTARLPDDLLEAIREHVSAFSTTELAAAAQRNSEAYREGLPPMLDAPARRAAYLATRLPATYAALTRAAAELPFEPGSWLDLGAGPGAAAWVARCPVTLVDANPRWEDLRPAKRICASLERLPGLEAHDVVSLAYVLNELAPAARAKLVEEAWRLAGRALVLVEPGTPQGFEILLAARRQLVESGARILAPCPHGGACPLEGKDWCHFAVRVERSRLHRQLKGGSLGFEDEKFCYLAVMREDARAADGRVLRHPEVRQGWIRLRLCTGDGVQERTVTRRDRQWRQARKVSWGDRWADADVADPGNLEQE